MSASSISFVVNIINHDTRSDTFEIEGSLSGISDERREAAAGLIFQFNDMTIVSEQYAARWNAADRTHIYTLRIPAGKDGTLGVSMVSSGEEPIRLNLEYSQISRLGGHGHFNYRIIKDKLVAPHHDSISFSHLSAGKIIFRELVFFFQSLRNNAGIKHNALKTLAIEPLRLTALMRMAINRPEIWLFSDRAVSGGDNSEVLFRYVSKRRDKKIKPYFTINADTDTYRQLKKEGYRVVKFRSIKHLYLAMVADILLPSHLDMTYLYPWAAWQKYSGLLRYAVVHTQHGIVLNDLSDYIGKHKKNAQLFLSICEWEEQHLIEERYGYTAQQTPVTGAPRYDELGTLPTGRVIALHPTWRSWLAADDNGGERGYAESFKQSSYYKFYQSLLNDDRIIRALRENDYKLKFYLHPNHRANRPDFTSRDERVVLMDFPYDYATMFSESALFITDYSNTLFDFAYLRKPIIHTQFDAGEFFSRQKSVKRQEFDYKTDGFGSVCEDYESAVEEIVKTVKTGVKMEKKYQERADVFFTYDDKNNSKRAYEAILEFRKGK